jgi:hypothetical protein
MSATKSQVVFIDNEVHTWPRRDYSAHDLNCCVSGSIVSYSNEEIRAESKTSLARCMLYATNNCILTVPGDDVY